MFYSATTARKKVLNIIHIKEALNIKVHITQKGGYFSVQLQVTFLKSE